MKVLVVGGGGREHALVWKLRQSSQVDRIYCAPGNAGVAKHADCVPIAASQIDELLQFAQENHIGLTVVGPEEPLVDGIVGRFQERGLPVFGVDAPAARLEGSKSFAKKLMKRHGIPTADFEVFSNPEDARECIHAREVPMVVKADGLAAGKGVFPCASRKEALEAVERIMVERAFGGAGDTLIIEDYLEGEEASFLAVTDGSTVIPFPSSQDHKAIYDGDKGPNTGGMGAYSPAPVVTSQLHHWIMDRIMRPTVRAMKEEGCPYRGVLYAGLMITGETARVLEYNVRLGDPEAQPLLMRLKGDLLEILTATIEGRLDQVSVSWDPRAAVCVVMASAGYPGPYEKGHPIHGLEEVEWMGDAVVFHAATSQKDGRIVTNGGRVLGVAAYGNEIGEAIDRTYKAAGRISWDGAYFRRDIGQRALLRR